MNSAAGMFHRIYFGVNWDIFKKNSAEAYSKPIKTPQKGAYCENTKRFSAVNYFCKRFRLRCLTESWEYASGQHGY